MSALPSQARFNQADERFDEVLDLAGDSPYDQTRAWLGKADNAVERMDRQGYRTYMGSAMTASGNIADGDARRQLQLAGGEVALRSNARMKLANRDLNTITATLAATLPTRPATEEPFPTPADCWVSSTCWRTGRRMRCGWPG